MEFHAAGRKQDRSASSKCVLDKDAFSHAEQKHVYRGSAKPGVAKRD